MKKKLTLFAILLLPTLIYIYFALGVPKAFRAPFFGPRHVVEIRDKNGNPKKDTAYYTVPQFIANTPGGGTFDTKTLDSRLYMAVFVHPDTLANLLPMLAQDIRLNHQTYKYARFIFIYPGDSAGMPAANAPDFGRELQLGKDTAYTLYVSPAKFDSLHYAHFIPDATRKEDPWKTWSDAVLIDHSGRIRGYYDIRSAAEIKRMKEDLRFINFHDQAAETIERTTIEQKR
jgi:hypothetical protein